MTGVARRVVEHRRRSSAGAGRGRRRRPGARAGTCRGGRGARSAAPTARRPARRDRRAPTSADRRSRPPAGGGPRPSAPGGGGSSRPRAARALSRPASRAGRGASAPVSHACAVAPASAIGPSWRRPPWPAKAASSGTCSRVWSVPGWSGSQPWSAVTSRRSSAPSRARQAAELVVDAPQRGVEARDVLAVAVELVGVDEVGEDQAGVETVDQGRRRGQRRLVVGPGVRLVDPAARRRSRRPCPRRGPGLPRGLERLQVGRARAGRRCSRAGPPCGRSCPARRRTAGRSRGRRRARPVITSRTRAHSACSSLERDAVLVGGELEHRVLRGVEDELAGLEVRPRRGGRSPPGR